MILNDGNIAWNEKGDMAEDMLMMTSGRKTKRSKSIYAVEKSALDKANHQLFYQGVNTTNVRFGYFDSPRVSHVDKKKMSIEYCVSIIDWILQQPHRVKEITITPSKD